MATSDFAGVAGRLDALDRVAAEAFNAGQLDEAERIWTLMRDLAPLHRNALWGLGTLALQRGDAVRARDLLHAAHRAAPRDTVVLMALAAACQACKDQDGEIAAIAAVLNVDPAHVPALLAKAAVLERMGHADAIPAYNDALEAASAAPQEWTQECCADLERARAIVEDHRQSLFDALSARMSSVSGDMPAEEQGRWREAASVMAGLTKPYNPEPHKLLVPRLPAIPFHDRAQFPWVEELEAKTEIIRDELMQALEVKQRDFVPYVTLDRTGATEAWSELNQSTRWSVFYLWKNGVRDEENIALCPETAKALEAVDQAHIQGACPNAMFSALAPRTHIPPHSGESNARLVCHLPLIVPEDCGALRVGFEQRPWKEGEALIFDDSIEHEAWNHSDDLRVVLLFDVWQPQLTPLEREAVNALVTAQAEFDSGR